MQVIPHGYSQTIRQRLDAKCVATANGCVEFTGARTEHGYGRLSRGGRGSGYERAHRVAWELANGPIPAGMWVLHRCDNPPCCNPKHLFLGTATDNVADMMAKGRGSGHIPSGEAHPDARLTDGDVAALRELAPSIGNYAALGRTFGISKQHARDLVLRLKRTA